MVGESRCSAWDCEFAALAQELGIKLVTSDQVILSAFPELAVHIRKFEPL
jgi:predicted nucleic acid-binding protein